MFLYMIVWIEDGPFKRSENSHTASFSVDIRYDWLLRDIKHILFKEKLFYALSPIHCYVLRDVRIPQCILLPTIIEGCHSVCFTAHLW